MDIRKVFKAETAHRLLYAHAERCRGVHGHSYVFELTISGRVDERTGMVMDFSEVKDRIGWFFDAFDHSLVVHRWDEFLVSIVDKLNPRHIILPYEPTAENFAMHAYSMGLYVGLPVVSVRVHETVTGYAEVSAHEGTESLQPFSPLYLGKVVYSPCLRNLIPNIL